MATQSNKRLSPLAVESSDLGEPLAKRPRALACARCRRRKQKCDDRRPCSNCTRSEAECLDPPQVYARPHGSFASVLGTQADLPNASSHLHLALSDDIALLREDISTLREMNRRLTAERDSLSSSKAAGVITSHRRRDLNGHEHESQRRRNSSVHLSTIESLSARGSPPLGLLHTLLSLDENQMSPGDRDDVNELEGSLDGCSQDALFAIYYDKVQCRYPFLQLDKFCHPDRRSSAPWAQFFVHLILSIGLLLKKQSSSKPSQVLYRLAVTRSLSSVFAQPDRVLHVQAYLLLAIHAMYSPSSERIVAITSATMRCCVMAHLHVAEAEPEPVTVCAKVEAQIRRRVFWSAYALDRTACTLFDLPFSIPDYQITTKMYADIDDQNLEESCAESFPDDPPSEHRLTNVSGALHIVYCRQIQSEILNTTLHRDFDKQFDQGFGWRVRVLEKLDYWKSLCHRYSSTDSMTYSSREWLHMIYNYSLAMLYQPNRATVAGPAGEWTVKSCIQACLIFRKFQRESPISELWLGLVMQFRCGVSLLYCFFATPQHQRSPAYKVSEASEAVRACSIILSIPAERWPQLKCLRDAFDILAKEIPLYELGSSEEAPPRRMRQEAADSITLLLEQIRPIVIHRNTLRMIREMATNEFPFLMETGGDEAPLQLGHIEGDLPTSPNGHNGELAVWRTPATADIFDPTIPSFFQEDLNQMNTDSFEFSALGFPGEFNPDILT